MMTDYWQNLVIVCVVSASVVYLVARLVRWRKRRRACNDCRLRELFGNREGRQSDKQFAN